jgi:hypothetical protein
MSRPMKHNQDNVKFLVKKYINKLLTEALDKPTSTEYEKILNIFSDGQKMDVYRFKTKLGNSYDVDFLKYKLWLDSTTIGKDKTLFDFIESDETKSTSMEYIDLGFTPTEIKDTEVSDEVVGTINDPYIAKTNRMEQFELLGKIAFLINEYIKNNPQYEIYTIGKNTHENNLNTYIKIFSKIFTSNFIMLEGKLYNYLYGSYFFVNKKCLK